MLYGTSGVSNSVRAALVNSSHKFILTGSRLFGEAKPNSDWDFFTQLDQGVEVFLKSLGFEELAFTDYKDMMTSKVYRHVEEKVDIQLVKDATLKLGAQEWLLSCGETKFYHLFHNADKRLKDAYWDFAICAVRGLSHGEGHYNGEDGPEKHRTPNYGILLGGFLSKED